VRSYEQPATAFLGGNSTSWAVPNLAAVFDKLKKMTKDIELPLKMCAARSYTELPAADSGGRATSWALPNLQLPSGSLTRSHRTLGFCKCCDVRSYVSFGEDRAARS
jgi:hypothetical protein